MRWAGDTRHAKVGGIWKLGNSKHSSDKEIKKIATGFM
jgi:hypothetical protein